MTTFTFRKPDDWHCHLRDDEYLKRTVHDCAQYFARAIVMPNLTPPITMVAQAANYQARIKNNLPTGSSFTPLMTLYLTENLSAEEITQVAKTETIKACKLYPHGITTNAGQGVKNIEKIFPVLQAMQDNDVPLLIHGESAKEGLDIFEREKFFIDNELTEIVRAFPKLRIVLEHITTQHAVDYIRQSNSNIAATITAHHLLYDRNILFKGGIRPHYFCLPIFKKTIDQQALIEAACSGENKFFLGTDSAPHMKKQKESDCGCAGIYSMPVALTCYLEIFERANALEHFEKFASVNGAQFYKLPLNTEQVTFVKRSWEAPKSLPYGKDELIPLKAGETLSWQMQHD